LGLTIIKIVKLLMVVFDLDLSRDLLFFFDLKESFLKNLSHESCVYQTQLK